MLGVFLEGGLVVLGGVEVEEDFVGFQSPFR